METIAEECEFSDSEPMEAGISQNDKKPPNDRIVQAKLSRKQRKGIVTKIRQKMEKTRKEEPPKWICSVQGCKWGGRYKTLLEAHIKSSHPDREGRLFIQPYFVLPKIENWPEPLEVKKLEVAVEQHKTAEELEKLEEEIRKL